jgi:hypothetical protein
VTHPLDGWLDAMAPGGRMILPLTGTMTVMGANIGKGLVLLLTGRDAGDFSAARDRLRRDLLRGRQRRHEVTKSRRALVGLRVFAASWLRLTTHPFTMIVLGRGNRRFGCS